MILLFLKRLLTGVFGTSTAGTARPASLRTPLRAVAIVEDNAFQRDVLERMVASVFSGCRCQVYDSPLEALEGIAGGDHVDLIISDVFMPDLDGFELVKRLRGFNPGLRSILVTSHEAEEIPDEKKGTVDALLFKPVTARLLGDVRARLS